MGKSSRLALLARATGVNLSGVELLQQPSARENSNNFGKIPPRRKIKVDFS